MKEVKFLFYSYIIVQKDESNIININIMTIQDYKDIDKYLHDNFNLYIKDLPINTTLVKIQGENNGQ